MGEYRYHNRLERDFSPNVVLSNRKRLGFGLRRLLIFDDFIVPQSRGDLSEGSFLVSKNELKAIMRRNSGDEGVKR